MLLPLRFLTIIEDPGLSRASLYLQEPAFYFTQVSLFSRHHLSMLTSSWALETKSFDLEPIFSGTCLEVLERAKRGKTNEGAGPKTKVTV